MTNVPAGAAISHVCGTLSRVLNRLTLGTPGQTLCARIAASSPDCLFCRLMARLVEPNHCLLELARWRAGNVPARTPRTKDRK